MFCGLVVGEDYVGEEVFEGDVGLGWVWGFEGEAVGALSNSKFMEITL